MLVPLPRCGVNGFANTQVGAAATQVAAHCGIDVGIGWIRDGGQQGGGRHDLSGLAVTALRHIVFDPCGLHGRELSVLRQSFDRGDALVRHRRDGQGA